MRAPTEPQRLLCIVSNMDAGGAETFLMKMYRQRGLANPAVVIYTNHSNSGKQYYEQIRIAKEVMHSRRYSSEVHDFVKGLMIESYIEPGAQNIGDGVYGKSITDPCLGWDQTERLIYDIAEVV